MNDLTEPYDLGVTIKKLRQQQSLSQQELARESGLSQAQISTMERGQGNPSLDVLNRVSAALGVPTWVLIGGLALVAIAGIIAVSNQTAKSSKGKSRRKTSSKKASSTTKRPRKVST